MATLPNCHSHSLGSSTGLAHHSITFSAVPSPPQLTTPSFLRSFVADSSPMTLCSRFSSAFSPSSGSFFIFWNQFWGSWVFPRGTFHRILPFPFHTFSCCPPLPCNRVTFPDQRCSASFWLLFSWYLLLAYFILFQRGKPWAFLWKY